MAFTLNPSTGELDFYNTKRSKLQAGTAGAVLFNSTTGRISEDATNLFWDSTNKRLGVGTNSPAINFHVLASADAGVAAGIQVHSATQSANLLDFRDNSGNAMTSFTNLGLARFISTNITFPSANNSVVLVGGGTATIPSNQTFSMYRVTGTYNFTASQTSGSSPGFYQNGFFQNDPSVTGNVGSTYGLFFGATIRGDTNATTANNPSAVADNTTFGVLNSGTLTVTSHNAVRSVPIYNTGATITTRRGLWYQANTGSGANTTSVALDAEATTATNNYIIQSALGSGANNYFLRSTGSAASVMLGSLAVGTTTQATAQLDVLAATSSTIGHIIKGAASQSADLLQCQDSSGNSLFEINSDGTVTYAPTNLTATTQSFFTSSSTLTGSGATPRIFNSSNTFIQQSSPIFGLPFLFANMQMAVQTNTNNVTMTAPVGYNYQPTNTADGVVWTGVDTFGAFVDNPTFTTANSGSYTTMFHTGFRSNLIVSAGTVTTRRGILITDATGAGTLTNQIGIRIGNLTKGGTSNIAIQSLGGESRHVGAVHIGVDSTPATKLEVGGDFCTTIVSAAFVSSPVSLTTTSSNVFETTAVSGAFTVNASTAGTAGQYLLYKFTSDAGATRVCTFGTNFKSTGTLATGGASKSATILFLSNGSAWWEVARTNNLGP